MSNKKIQEADALMKEGEKNTQTVLFGLLGKPDWGIAAMKFEKAATAYRVAKEFKQAASAFIKASDAHSKNEIPNSAAKCMENAGLMYKELKQFDLSSVTYEKAAGLYVESLNPIKRGECLLLAAEVVEDSNPDRAIKMARESVEAYEEDDKGLHADNSMNFLNRILLAQKKYMEAIEVFRYEVGINAKINQPHEIFKLYLGIIVLQLALDDFVSAKQSFRDFTSSDDFPRSDEFEVASKLVQGFEDRNPELVEAAKKLHCLTYQIHGISRIVQNLKVSGAVNRNEPPTDPLAELAEYDKEGDSEGGLA